MTRQTRADRSLRLSLGRKLRALREVSGKTRRIVSNEVHVTERTIASWEAGDTMPDAVQLARLAKSYGCSLVDIMTTTAQSAA